MVRLQALSPRHAEQRIRLRLVAYAKLDRVLNTDGEIVANDRVEQMTEAIDGLNVPTTDETLSDNLPPINLTRSSSVNMPISPIRS